MKTLVLLFSFLYAATPGMCQEPLSRVEALGKIYNQYNNANKTAQWVCAKDRQKDDPCWVGDDATVSVTLLLAAEVTEDGIKKTYIVASARPSNKDRWECHVCGPAVGIAVFALESNRWVLQSKNEATGFFGSFGEPGDVSLVAIGPRRHGVMFSTDYGGQGYYESTETLLIPLGANVATVWSEKVRLDDQRDDDAHERKMSNRLQYVSSSGVSFYWVGGPDSGLQNDYYDIAVVSHRSSYRIKTRWAKQEYWQDTYEFDGSKYLRTSHQKISRANQASKMPQALKRY